MINTFRAKNYGCLKDVTVGLTPLHAFIGPNDSGKSTILRGIRTVVQFAGGKFTPSGGLLHPFDPQLDTRRSSGNGPSTETIVACGIGTEWYGIVQITDSKTTEVLGSSSSGVGEAPATAAGRAWSEKSALLSAKTADPAIHALRNELRGVRLLRLDPDSLREPSPLIPENEPLDFFSERGFGLPSVYQAVLGRGDEASDTIRSAIRKLFPMIRRIGVKSSSDNRFALEGELQNGNTIRASAMSEGLLYFLAFLVLQYLEPVSILLIEEPENGLHPARIQQVLQTMREFVDQSGTQVIMATHSPLVINELNPEEVSVVTRPSLEEGTKVTPIKDTPNFEKRSSVYALGELWLAYADGNVEAPLFAAGAR